jgi:AmmeMemoRadiSam system protein B
VDTLPRLRTDIQLLPVETQDRRMLAVRDMLGLREAFVALAPELAGFLPLFDGEHTILDLQEAMMRARGNRLVLRAEAEQLIQSLDESLILPSDRYLSEKQELRRQFAGLPRRPAALAGSAYPGNPEDARAFVRAVLANRESTEPSPAVRALIAPHIDLRVGTAAYRAAYSLLGDREFQRIVILGTGHGLDDGLFSVSSKIYETPLGSFPSDVHAIERLRQAGAGWLAPDDFAHRNEHSIEFQALFLRAVLQHEIPLVPILVGGVGGHLISCRRLADIPGVDGFLEVLREICCSNTLLVAGVDFSHVGPKFGHQDAAARYQKEFEEHDRRLLAALCRGSAEEFWAEGQRVRDCYHVCGFSSLATLLEILPGATGRVLGYEVWHEAATRSAVSFAAAVLN